MKPEVHARLEAAVAALVPLPVFGGTVARVRTLAADERASTAELVAVVQGDEAFTANLLRYANTAAHARPVRASSVRQAVTLLGRRALGRLAVEAATYRLLELAAGTGASRGQLHVHAVTVAGCAVRAAEQTGTPVEEVHLAALLHDIGKLVLPVAFGEAAVDAIVAEAPLGVLRARLERERLGVDHAYAGALLARRSGAPESVAAAIQHHHGGRSGQESPSKEASCVQVANATVHLLAGRDPGDELTALALRMLQLSPAALDDIAQAAAPPGSAPDSGPLSGRVAELERLASTDELTGLANRRAWLQHATDRLAHDRAGVLLLCDVDRFKTINDSYGHRAGDVVLAEVGRVLGRHGVAGRLGGDEFAVWLTGTHAEAQRTASTIVAACRQHIDAVEAVSVSIGVAAAPEHGSEVIELLEAADRALYAAKAAGRNRAVSAP